MKKLLEFLAFYTMLALMWVGAEFVFEGAVHSSYVDAFVCAILAKFVQRGVDEI